MTLTPEERELLAIAGAADSLKAAAPTLGLAEGTLRNRLSRMYRRHGVSGLPQMLYRYRRELNGDHQKAA